MVKSYPLEKLCPPILIWHGWQYGKGQGGRYEFEVGRKCPDQNIFGTK